METRQRTPTNKLPQENTDLSPQSNESSNAEAGDENRAHTETTTNQKQQDDKEEEKNDSTFECNICLDIARDAVISLCGHLFW